MEEKKITIDNLKINYKIAGSGPAILVLHGWGSNSEKWQKIGDLLVNSGMKVIIPDLPGFGKSQEPFEPWGLDNYCHFIERFISVLDLDKFYLLGHSSGGSIAVKYCLKFPERIEKLFLVAPACIRKKTFQKKILATFAKIFKIFSFLSFYCSIRKLFYKFLVRRSDYPYTEGLMKETYLKIIKEDLSDILEQIQIPTIIIWGKKDKIKRIKEAYLIKKKIKNSKLEIILKASHSPHLETPEELTKIILP